MFLLRGHYELKEKKSSKKKLFTVSIIILFYAVGLLAYFWTEKSFAGHIIIGCMACSEWGVKFVKKKLDKNL